MAFFVEKSINTKSDIKSVFPLTIQIYKICNDLSIVFAKKIEKIKIIRDYSRFVLIYSKNHMFLAKKLLNSL